MNLINKSHVIITSALNLLKLVLQSSKNFAILHLNIHSIQLHIEELRIILGTLDYMFDIIAISESKLKNDPKVDISLRAITLHIVNTEAEKGGTILYVTSQSSQF